jgi:hypothetical protein
MFIRGYWGYEGHLTLCSTKVIPNNAEYERYAVDHWVEVNKFTTNYIIDIHKHNK